MLVTSLLHHFFHNSPARHRRDLESYYFKVVVKGSAGIESLKMGASPQFIPFVLPRVTLASGWEIRCHFHPITTLRSILASLRLDTHFIWRKHSCPTLWASSRLSQLLSFLSSILTARLLCRHSINAHQPHTNFHAFQICQTSFPTHNLEAIRDHGNQGISRHDVVSVPPVCSWASAAGYQTGCFPSNPVDKVFLSHVSSFLFRCGTAGVV